MNPSCLSVCARETFILEAGISVKSCRAVRALRILVSISAIGSVIMALVLPAGLLHSRQVAFQGQLAEADTAEREGPQVGTRAAAAVAAVAVPHLELRLLVERLLVECLSGHFISSYRRANGIPSSSSSRFPSSSVRAEVVMFTWRPRMRSILSYSISGKMSCSRMPRLKLPRPSNELGEDRK